VIDRSATYCNCLYYSANALARTITRLAEVAFSPTGLAPSYAFLLMSVNHQPEGITPTELSEIMMLTPSTVTRLVDRMEGKGLVTRASEGRNTIIRPTKAGLELQPRIKEAWRDLKESYAAILGPEADELAACIYRTTKTLEAV